MTGRGLELMSNRFSGSTGICPFRPTETALSGGRVCHRAGDEGNDEGKWKRNLLDSHMGLQKTAGVECAVFAVGAKYSLALEKIFSIGEIETFTFT